MTVLATLVLLLATTLGQAQGKRLRNMFTMAKTNLLHLVGQ